MPGHCVAQLVCRQVMSASYSDAPVGLWVAQLFTQVWSPEAQAPAQVRKVMHGLPVAEQVPHWARQLVSMQVSHAGMLVPRPHAEGAPASPCGIPLHAEVQ
jgi:hypothetical protein